MRAQQQVTRSLKTFLEVSVQLTEDLDSDQVLETIVERARDLTDAIHGAAISLRDDGTIDGFVYRGPELKDAAVLGDLPEGKGMFGLVLEAHESVRVDDGAPSMDTFLGVPLQHRGRLVGALYLWKGRGADRFTADDEELVQAIGSIAAVGIDNARLFSRESQRAERGALLAEIASKVRCSLDVQSVLAATVEVLGRAARVDRCLITLAEGSSGELDGSPAQWAAPGVPALQDDPQRHHPVSVLAAETRSTRALEDALADLRLDDSSARDEAARTAAARAALSTPLEWGEDLIGVITFHVLRPRQWTEADVALIEAAGREVSIALQHARMYSDAVRTAEKLRELDEMRSNFVSMVSHELRSPMTVVAGIADILAKRRGRLSPEQQEELIDTLGREARRLTRLVSEALDLEAIDKGRLHLQIENVDLNELAHEALADAGHSDRTELVLPQRDAVVPGDRDKLKQVLLNLVSNAAKFSEPDAPITVTVEPEEAAVEVRVRDRGPGIAAEDQERLFQRFSRLRKDGNRQPGSGLGLYLSREIVELHGGNIWLESDQGCGATFSFRLPRKPPTP